MLNQRHDQTIANAKASLDAERQLQSLANDIDATLLNVFPDSATFTRKTNFVYEIAALFTVVGIPFHLYRGEAWSAERGKLDLEGAEGHEWLEVPTRFGRVIVDPTLRCKLMDVWEDGIDFDIPTVLTPKQAAGIGRAFCGERQPLDDYFFSTNTNEAENALGDVRLLAENHARFFGSVAAERREPAVLETD
ncbi:hypothetical protein VRRI112168_02425 [Vreelandella rituensis]|uniref:Uncharacterized protein n=1 Tax=Vreelandella rituensis TaxID=2282306 RepID=A0A368U8T9_9GAMM|nr:hypothetical protein [Halomonas rituensis]RCV93599.1 hypothetical protein DU506_00145 [Halomonas rituensis]